MAQSRSSTLPSSQSSARLEGGKGEEENPDAASPSSEKPRNSSGSASAAASQLDLRQRLNLLEQVMLDVLVSLGDEPNQIRIKLARQKGFRFQR